MIELVLILLMLALAISIAIFQCSRKEEKGMQEVQKEVQPTESFLTVKVDNGGEKQKKVHFKETVLVHPIPSMKRADFPEYFGAPVLRMA